MVERLIGEALEVRAKIKKRGKEKEKNSVSCGNEERKKDKEEVIRKREEL